jgi:metal-dependent amidase/aminoacylase/carboxypeptidase family protein
MRHDHDLVSIYRRNAGALGRSFIDPDPKTPPVMGRQRAMGAGSTDMGNVSLQLPAIHPLIGINSSPAVNHQPEFTAACATPDANRAIVYGAIAMAWTAIDIANDKTLRDRLMNAR